ncbi:GPW/gp25 family protein [Piscinibacter sakaiensis]|uniref:GPW/gp25 family protein n=1 Tax=Piscinibacter sakaiensis TaxID=1547922 RepID=UPI003AAE4383
MTTRDPALAPPIGWPLLGVPDADGQWNWPSLERSVAEGLRKLLSVRPGELLMHADYGAGLQDFLHEPNTLAVRARIKARIEAAVARDETRVVLDRVEVREDDADAAAVRVELHYRLRRSGAPQQLSLAMNLGG